MNEIREPLWTIEELGSQVALALSENYDGQRNGSVRDVPDQRTIRFYTTRGLLDRPAQMRGRTALYSRRHLLQLVAIKRLQRKGLSLVQVQKQLHGLTNSALQRLAQLPSSYVFAEREPEVDEEERHQRQQPFWRQPPAEFAESLPGEHNESGAPPSVIQGMRLANGVTLLLELDRPLEDDDLQALEAAAGPLLKLLHKRRLLA